MTMTRRISLVRFLQKVWQYTIRANHPCVTNHNNAGPAPSSATICTACRYYQDISSGFEPGIWYNMVCIASPMPVCMDWTTGKPGSLHQRYDYCRNVNTNGRCVKYVACGEENIPGQATY